jgi:hypothetical protein
MKSIKQFLLEARQDKVPFILHKHNPRNGSEHFDLRFLDPNDDKLLHSFAFGSDFLEKVSDRIVGVKTRDHDPRWLTLKSYRLKDIDRGTVIVKIGTKKYFELEFSGKIIKGKYKLFKVKSKRGDNWLLIKQK